MGTVGPEDGDIIFDADRYVHTDIGVNNSLIVKAERNITFTANDGVEFEGNGHVELYAGLEGSVTSIDRGKNPPNISTVKGDIIIEAGRGGIDLGVLQAGDPSTSGEERPGEIRLKTVNAEPGTIAEDGEYDIALQHMGIHGKGYGSVYVSSAGNLTIEGTESLGGAIQVKTVTTADGEDALTFVCLGAEKNVTVTGDVLADAQGAGTSVASIWIGAGTHNEDPVEGYYGTVTLNGNVQADASAAGSFKADAAVRIYGSTINLNGSKAPEALGQGSVQIQSAVTDYVDSEDAVYEKKDPEDPAPIDPLFDNLVSGSRALVEIDTSKDATCLDCANIVRIVLPVATDDTWVDSKNIAVIVEVLFNDKESAAAAEGSLVDGMVYLDNFTSANGGTLALTNGDTEVQYTPPEDWADNFQDGAYTDAFYYYAVDSNGDVSEEPALVTITLINQNPIATDNDYTSGHNVVLDVADSANGAIELDSGYGVDYDPDNDALAMTVVDGPDYGALDYDSATGTFAYTPSPGNPGTTDSFAYYVTDGYGGQSETATVNINLSNTNPVATDNDYNSGHNVVLNVVDSANGVIELDSGYGVDYDPDNEGEAYDADINPDGWLFQDELTVTIVDGPDYGVLDYDSATGTFAYTPSPGNPGNTDSYTYHVTDGYGGQSETATVNIDLSNTNPVATDNDYNSGHNVVLNVADSANGVIELDSGYGVDYDPDNEGEAYDADTNPGGWLFQDDLDVVSYTQPTYGTVSFNEETGTFTYSPDEISMRDNTTLENDSFTYTLSDGFGGTGVGTVTIDLSNQAPDAVDDFYTDVSHNLVLDVDDVSGVILGVGTDTDIDNQGEVYDVDTNPDGWLFQDDLDVVSYTQPTYGTVSFNEETGAFTYTPDETSMLANTTLEDDSFTYTLSDGFGGTGTAAVTISLINEAPVANPDLYSVGHDTAFVASVDQGTVEGLLPTSGDFDPDNQNPDRLFDDGLDAFLDDGGVTTMGGSVTLNPDGSFTYEPPAGWVGTDSFSYYVSDDYGGNSETVQVMLYVDSLPFMPPAPGLEPVELETSGCPALIAWAADELGMEGQMLDVWVSNSLASSRVIQSCDACGRLRIAATVLRDAGGIRVAALEQVISKFASSNTPPTEEQMASIAQAITNNVEANDELILAGEYLDALAEYVSILSLELGFSESESAQFVMDNYVDRLADNADTAVAAFVAARLVASTGN